MNTLFDELGYLNIEDLILQQPSFKKIMEDGVVTEEELNNQASRVMTLLKDIEKDATPEMIDKIRNLLAEMGVLATAKYFFEK